MSANLKMFRGVAKGVIDKKEKKEKKDKKDKKDKKVRRPDPPPHPRLTRPDLTYTGGQEAPPGQRRRRDTGPPVVRRAVQGHWRRHGVGKGTYPYPRAPACVTVAVSPHTHNYTHLRCGRPDPTLTRPL